MPTWLLGWLLTRLPLLLQVDALPTVTNDFNPAANTLDYCTDGTVTITWTITDLCETQTAAATYTYTAPEALTFQTRIIDDSNAASLTLLLLAEAQALLNADLAAWVAANQTAAAAAGGCSPTVTNDFNPAANTLDYCTDGP